MGYNGLDIISDELNELDQFIRESIVSPEMFISNAINDFVTAGGKRIRPALTILIGKALRFRKEKLIPVAASMEIIHMATLVHDDIVDNAVLRRNNETVQSRYGKDVAVFTGDYLFSKAFLIISQYAKKESLKGFADAIKRICEGEIEQYESRYSTDISLLKYLRRIRRKTGVLMSLSCKAGVFSWGKSKLVKNLGEYGMNLGLAFQITDDVLDFVGDENTIGKPVGNDVRQGVYTLPLIYALNYSKYRNELSELLKKEEYDSEHINSVIEIVKLSGGIEFSQKLAERYIVKGIENVQCLKNNRYKDALIELIQNLNKRDY